MKNQLFAAAALAAFLAPGSSAPQQGTDELEALRQEVTAQAAAISSLQKDLAATQTLVDQTVAHLRAQGAAAAEMQATFKSSVELGFLAGINPRSREVLLAGFEAYMNVAQKDLPGTPPPAKDKGKRGERR